MKTILIAAILLLVCHTECVLACSWKGEVLDRRTGEIKTYAVEKGVSPSMTLKGNNVDATCFFVRIFENQSVGGEKVTLDIVNITCSFAGSGQSMGTSAAASFAPGAKPIFQNANLFLYDLLFKQAFRLSVKCE